MSDSGQLTALRPGSVNLHTSQSGLIGLLNQGSAQPFSMQCRIVRSLILWPSESNNGSLPPACSRPRRNHACCADEGFLSASAASRTLAVFDFLAMDHVPARMLST